MDEYIARIMVPVKKFQLLGCTCILLAAKLEQIVVCFRRVINCAVPNIARDDRCRV
jgi:hypothetical protein